ncbi:hypothetical protein CPTAKMNP4_195 [Salmonella phage vB_SenM-AKM_NP4]|uniref:Uncharacterized protein n=2 Tax=Gelderlandvirus TaxID=1913653 RepID=K4I303_9CAUD|nr:hypothetical protein ACQ31_gp255 [Salmonella phage STML-198]YP_009615675.1 hypothetical protein FDI73_gp201 [Salmonella phage Melville]UFK27057.1 hypothetical protein LG358_00036 [Escherichia phage UoN_LG358_1]UPW42308.1 hypothetical protein EBPHNEJP_00010 [Salmonella phage CF-SP2]WDR21856.1 hypothetical protein PJM34_0188 [Salmonella phage vB_SenM_UTK0003]WKV23543.1 hypothetical protein SEA1_gp0195 [Salmonella phage SEA1]WLI71817.1 hypothetical protein CPTAKMNP4_195 [Salmonella phage vB_S
MSYDILLEVTVLSDNGNVAITTNQLEFNSWDIADKYFEDVVSFEEAPGIKIWRQVTKMY